MKNLPGRMKLALVVLGGFIVMSMFMTLQGPAPALPLGSDPSAAAVRQAPATDERTARTDAEQMQRNFEEASARARLDQSRALVAPVPAPIVADPDTRLYSAQSRGRGRELSQPGEEPLAPKPGFVTRRRTVPSQGDTPASPALAPGEAPPAAPDASPRLVAAPEPPVGTARATTVREGTVIDAVLANRLNGSAVGPVVARVTNPIYGYDGTTVLIPQGATVIGESQAVIEFGRTAWR